MTTAREDIIGSIRRHLATSRPFDAIHGEHRVAHAEAIANKALPADTLRDIRTLLDNFHASAGPLGIQLEIADDEREAAVHIKSVIDRIGAKEIAISDSGLVAKVVETIETAEFTPDASTDFLFGSDLGITSAQWAIAETGTLVLESNNERHRLVSLVPPVHICLIKAETIRQTMGEVLELTARDLSRVVTFITGASRTSDIELTLAIGVHGPGELIVIVINDK